MTGIVHIVLARKPLSESTVAGNCLKHGVGALNIDECRVGSDKINTHSRGKNEAFPKRPTEKTVEESGRKTRQDLVDMGDREGRFPANVIFGEGCPVMELDRQSGQKSSGMPDFRRKAHETHSMSGRLNITNLQETGYGDSGGASRFFKQVNEIKKENKYGTSE